MKKNIKKALNRGWELFYKPFCKGYGQGTLVWLLIMIPVSVVGGWICKDVETP